MKKLLFCLPLLVLLQSQVHAQIAYHDIYPDTTINTWNAWGFAPMPASAGSEIMLWYHPGEISVQSWNDCEILFDATGSLPLKLNAGDSIGSASGKYKLGNYDVLSSGGNGNWATNATDKFLGFRVKNGTKLWNYGWLKMTVAPNDASFTVQSWAYNTSGNKINAGQFTVVGINNVTNPNIGVAIDNKKIRFTNLQAAHYKVTVANAAGQVVSKADINNNDVIDLSNAAAGIYMVQLSNNEFVHAFKIALP